MQNPEQYSSQYEGQTPPYSQQAYTQQVPPPPPYGQAYTQPAPGAQHSQDSVVALIVEAVCAVFSIYGLGWILRGKLGTGVALLAGGIVWAGVVIVGSVITGGLAALCFGPLHVIFVVTDILMLNRALRRQ